MLDFKERNGDITTDAITVPSKTIEEGQGSP